MTTYRKMMGKQGGGSVNGGWERRSDDRGCMNYCSSGTGRSGNTTVRGRGRDNGGKGRILSKEIYLCIGEA